MVPLGADQQRRSVSPLRLVGYSRYGYGPRQLLPGAVPSLNTTRGKDECAPDVQDLCVELSSKARIPDLVG